MALPAIVVGRAGLVVIDCDRHPGGDDGIKAFNRLLSANGGNLADVPITKTANGGAHLFFKQPKGEPLGNGRGELPDGIDVRGVGGFVIAPDAVLPDGKGWQSVNGRPLLADAFKAGTIPKLPQWLADNIRPNRQPTRDGIDEYVRGFADMPGAIGISRGEAYAAAALQGAAAELSTAPTGKRNETLNAVAFRLGKMVARGWIDEETVTDALLGACDANRYLREHGHRATMKTIESGIEAGKKEPHPDLPDRNPSSGGNGPADSDLSGLSGLSGIRGPNRDEQHARGRRAKTGTWDEPDRTLLDDRRGELPDFPVEALPVSLRGWLLRAARGAGVTPAHVAVPLLGIALSLIGTARRVRACRSWSEPLTMWVGGASRTGRSRNRGALSGRRAVRAVRVSYERKVLARCHLRRERARTARPSETE